MGGSSVPWGPIVITDAVAEVDTKKKLIVVISSYNGSNSMDVLGSVSVGVEGAMGSNLKTGS